MLATVIGNNGFVMILSNSGKMIANRNDCFIGQYVFGEAFRAVHDSTETAEQFTMLEGGFFDLPILDTRHSSSVYFENHYQYAQDKE